MENKKWVRFVESFILLPVLTISSAPVGVISQAVVSIVNTPSVVSSQKQNIEVYGLLAVNSAVDQKLAEQKTKAQAIDVYFEARNMPLKGMGMKMVFEAEKNNLDWHGKQFYFSSQEFSNQQSF